VDLFRGDAYALAVERMPGSAIRPLTRGARRRRSE
jgi:hypothetical protein